MAARNATKIAFGFVVAGACMSSEDASSYEIDASNL
jgi:hypothetical protein